ncbi:MAG: DUF503 domain-containing protein [Caldicoprobacterales bacterium]
MTVYVIKIRLHAPWVHSLKEKRAITKGLCNKLRNKFNVSVVESDALDIHQTIVLSIAFLAGSNGLADSIGEKICRFVEENTDAEVADIQIERR